MNLGIDLGACCRNCEEGMPCCDRAVNLGNLGIDIGSVPLPDIQMPKQIRPETVYLIGGIAVGLVALSVFFYSMQRR